MVFGICVFIPDCAEEMEGVESSGGLYADRLRTMTGKCWFSYASILLLSTYRNQGRCNDAEKPPKPNNGNKENSFRQDFFKQFTKPPSTTRTAIIRTKEMDPY